MPFTDETMRDINRANAAVGGLVFMPDQWDQVDALSEAMDDLVSLELSPLDRDPVAMRLASWMIHHHVESWEEYSREVDTRWHPGYDESDPASMTCPYVLIYGNHCQVVPLQHIAQYKEATPILLRDIRNCQAHITSDCFTELRARKFLAVKRGEYICIFRICTSCLTHIQHGKGFDNEYMGPQEDWFDDRQPPPRDEDDWDVGGGKGPMS